MKSLLSKLTNPPVVKPRAFDTFFFQKFSPPKKHFTHHTDQQVLVCPGSHWLDDINPQQNRPFLESSMKIRPFNTACSSGMICHPAHSICCPLRTAVLHWTY